MTRSMPVNIGNSNSARVKNSDADWQRWREEQLEKDRARDSRFERISPGRILPIFYDDEEGEL